MIVLVFPPVWEGLERWALFWAVFFPFSVGQVADIKTGKDCDFHTGVGVLERSHSLYLYL